MLNESCPQPGSADAQSSNPPVTGDLVRRLHLVTQVAHSMPTRVSSVAPMPTSMDEVAKLRPGCSSAYQQRLLALCKEFSAITGCRDFAIFRSTDVTDYVEAALARGLSTATLLLNVNALARLRRSAGCVALGPKQEDPFQAARSLLKARSTHRAPRELMQQLDAVWHLLNDEEFISFKDSSIFAQRATYWMVLLSLFTDMKVTELSHMSPADFAWSSYAGYLIRQRAQEPGRVQLHPVHNVLIQCGFVDFVAERWATKATYLFSDSERLESVSRAARRHICDSWSLRGCRVPAPSWKEFRAARRSAAARVLGTHPDLRARLERSCCQGDSSAEAMDLVLDLEKAYRFDDVNWARHIDSIAPVPNAQR